MSPAAPEATNRASTTPRSDGVARLVGRGGEVATATGRTPRCWMQTRSRLPDGGRPGKRASTGPAGGRGRAGPPDGGRGTVRARAASQQQAPRREGGHGASPGGGWGGPGRDGDRGRVRRAGERWRLQGRRGGRPI